MAKSLLYVPGAIVSVPPACAPCRQEVKVTLKKDGRLYHMTVRDKTVVEDPYLVMVKAVAFAVQTGEPYMARAIPRSVKDYYIKSNVLG